MLKLIYITAQGEGTSHASISAFFGKYLRNFMHVIRVFVSSGIQMTQRIGDDIFIPIKLKRNIFREIGKYEDLKQINIILIRNYYSFLKQAIKIRRKNCYTFLIGFQQSYPFAFEKYYLSLKYDKSVIKKLIKFFDYKRKKFLNRGLLDKTDFFIPISYALYNQFYNFYKKELYPMGMGFDFDLIKQMYTKSYKDGYNFIYIGTVNKTREFDTILKAFENLKGDWTLDIYTRNVDFSENDK